MATLQSIREQIRKAIDDGDLGSALSLIELAQRCFPEDFETLELFGRIHLESGRFADARAAFQAVLEVDPERVLARSALGIIAEEEGSLDEALEHLERAFATNVSNRHIAAEIARLHSRLGYSRPAAPGFSMYATAAGLMKEGKHEKAIPLLEESIRLQPEMWEAAVGLAEALWHSRRLAEAEQVARQILADHPNCLKALAIAAGAALARGEEGAGPLLERCGRLNPGSRVARAILEEASLPLPQGMDGADLSDEQEDVVSEFPHVLQMDEWGEPGEVDAVPSVAAEVKDGTCRPELASDGGAEPQTVSGERTVGEDGAEVGQPQRQEAGRELLASGGVDAGAGRQGDAELHMAFGRYFESRGQGEFALAEYRTALRLDPGLAARVAEATGAMVEADPANLKARWLLGDALAASGQFRCAVRHYLSALKGHNRVSP